MSARPTARAAPREPILPPRTRLLVFARAPVAGACKTRLAAGLGTARALAVHRAMVTQTVAKAMAVEGALVTLWCSPAPNHAFFHGLRRAYDLPLRRQPRGGLGIRMHLALAGALADSERAVLVGSDCPGLTTAVLARALAALEEADAVFAPTLDGGYGLVGLRRPQARLFHGIPWSTARVMRATRARLRALGLRAHELPAIADIDDVRGYRRARATGLLPRRVRKQ